MIPHQKNPSSSRDLRDEKCTFTLVTCKNSSTITFIVPATTITSVPLFFRFLASSSFPRRRPRPQISVCPCLFIGSLPGVPSSQTCQGSSRVRATPDFRFTGGFFFRMLLSLSALVGPGVVDGDGLTVWEFVLDTYCLVEISGLEMGFSTLTGVD